MMPVEKAIIELLRINGPCCIDDVVAYLPDLTWGEVFRAIDRMSRDGRVSLLQIGYSMYQISLGSQFAYQAPLHRAEVEGWRDSPTPGV